MYQHIKRPATDKEAKNSTISSRINAGGHYFINGRIAMDCWGRLFLDFILTASNREFAYLRWLVAKRGDGFENFKRPITDKDPRLSHGWQSDPRDAFTWLCQRGKVKALRRLITATDIVPPARAEALINKAHKVAAAIAEKEQSKPIKPVKPSVAKGINDAEHTNPTLPPPADSAAFCATKGLLDDRQPVIDGKWPLIPPTGDPIEKVADRLWNLFNPASQSKVQQNNLLKGKYKLGYRLKCWYRRNKGWIAGVAFATAMAVATALVAYYG